MHHSSMATGWVKDTLLRHAQNTPDSVALRHRYKKETDVVSYRQLLSSSYTLAKQWHPFLASHQCALLLLPGNTHFVIGLTTCVMCGVSAIPVHLTNSFRIHRSADTIQHIIEESQPAYILTLSSVSMT